MKVEVEVCVTSVDEVLAAQRCGADTVELCTCLDRGGLTPSAGLVEEALVHATVPVRLLVRPLAAGFFHVATEQAVLLKDVAWALGTSHAPRLVLGALDAGGRADLVPFGAALAGAVECTFHRAIDHALDPLADLERCMEAGFHRILTSGGGGTALAGVPGLRAMVDRVPGRSVIAAAGSISPDNVVEIVERTGVRSVHFAAQRPAGNRVPFAFLPDEAKIEGVLAALVKAGLR